MPCFAPRGCPSRNRRGRKGPGSVGTDDGAEVFAELGGEQVGAFLVQVAGVVEVG